MESLLSLRAAVAEILALSVLDLFPGTFLGECTLSDTQYRYQFLFQQPKHPELLIVLEEKMRGALKAEPLIETVEMATKSAVQFFEYHDQPFKAEAAELLSDVTLPLIRIGDFYDLMHIKPYSKDFSSVAFQLLEAKEVEKEGELWVEITGTAFFSKEELKAFIKHRKAWLKAKPWEALERYELGCMMGKEIALLPKGVEIFQGLERFWRKSILANSEFKEVAVRNREHYPILAERFRAQIAEWAPDQDLTDHCFFLTSEAQLQQRCISSLQFIRQTFNMLSLSADWVLCEKTDSDRHSKHRKKEMQLLKSALEACGFPYTVEVTKNSSHDAARSYVELRVHDTLGERWPGPFLSVSLTPSLVAIEYSLLGPIKRLIALLAEITTGGMNEMKEKIKQLES